MRSPSNLTRTAVLASGVAMVLLGWSISRRFVAHGIAARAVKNPATSRAALSELAQLGDAALPALLDSATCEDREVAIPARVELEALLERWAVSRPADFELRCAEVIEGLTRREPQLTPSGRAWSRRLGDQALRLINAHPSGDSPRLLAMVEHLFEISQLPSEHLDQPLRPRTIRPIPLPPTADSGATIARGREAVPAVQAFESPPADTAALAAPSDPPQPPQPSEPEVAAGTSPAPPEPMEPTEPSRPAPTASGPGSLAWRQPTGIDGAREPRPLAPETSSVGPVNAPQPTSPTAPPGEDAPTLSEQAKQMLAGTTREKLQLVAELLEGRHQDPATILLTLAKDPEPRVRMAAISALASTTNQRLTEAAYRLAVHDEDPKVARLANELQKLLR